jgi:hypothetical protein
MDKNFAAWMIAGGPLVQTHAEIREREQLLAFREGQRHEHVGLIDRLRGFARPKTAEADLTCCAA